MSRLWVVAAIAGLAAASSGCYEPAHIPPKPTPEKIVRHNAHDEISREFARKPELKKELGKFLEKLGDADTTDELYAAWLAIYPDYPRVIRRTIQKSMDDFYWPVGPVHGRSVFVDGFRRAAEDIAEEATEVTKES